MSGTWRPLPRQLPRVVLVLALASATVDFALAYGPGRATPGQDCTAGIRIEVVSQRWLTDKEIEELEDVIGVDMSVRIRLSNGRQKHVLYLALAESIMPIGVVVTRRLGDDKWQYPYPRDSRPEDSWFDGVAFHWLELPPKSSVEFERTDYSASDEEHAVTAYIKARKEDALVELVSEPYHPFPRSTGGRKP